MAAWVLAARLVQRAWPAAPAVVWLLRGSSAVTLASLIALLIGVTSLWLVLVLGVASLLLLAGASLRIFSPAVAVSVAGVALACASLTTALAVTSGFRHELLRSVTRLSGHVTLTKYGQDFYEYPALRERVMADERVIAGSPFVFSMMAIVGPVASHYDPGESGEASQSDAESDDPWAATAEPLEGSPVVATGKGMDPTLLVHPEGLREVLHEGRLDALRPGDVGQRQDPGIVLGKQLAARVGVEIGDYVRVVVPAKVDGTRELSTDAAPPRSATFKVLDLFETGTREFDRKFALLHLTAGQAVFLGQRRVNGIEFELADPNQAAAVAADIAQTLGYPYRAATWHEANRGLLATIDRIRMVLSIILGLMVIVAAASVISSLLLIVRRKRHDIAILMAVGADRRTVFWAFEGIGLLIGAVGSAFGVAMAGAYCLAIASVRFPLAPDAYPVDHLPVAIRAIDVLGPVTIAMLMCAAASGPMAIMAARVPVLQALRR